MSRRKVLFVAAVFVSIASMCGAANSHAQGTQPCQAIKEYLGTWVKSSKRQYTRLGRREKRNIKERGCPNRVP